MTTQQAPGMAHPQAGAQGQHGAAQQQIQQQSQPQPQERWFIQCNGNMVPASVLGAHIQHARAQANNGGNVPPEIRHELVWMLQQHYPQHPFLKGQHIAPPQSTRPEVLLHLSATGRSGPLSEAQKMAMLSHIEQRRMVAQSAALNAGPQHQPQQPNAHSPNRIRANARQPAGQQPGQPSTPAKWPIFTLNAAPNGQVAQRRQVLGALSIDPEPANGAMPVSMPGQQISGRPQSAHSHHGSPPSTTPYGQGARSASQATQHTTSPSLPPLPWSQSAGSTSRVPSPQQSASTNTQAPRPSSAGPFGQDVRSPSQPSPFKTHPMSIELPPGPNFRPPSAPMLPQGAGANLNVSKSRRGSAPAMGMFPPPLSRSPSFQPQTPTLQQRPMANGANAASNGSTKQDTQQFLQAMNMTLAEARQLSPKKRQKLQEKWHTWHRATEQRKAAAMQPPTRPDNIIDLTGTSTGTSTSKKRKPGPATATMRPPKKHLTIDLSAHAQNRPRTPKDEPNCGFGPNTTVIRSTPPLRPVSPQRLHTNMAPQLAMPLPPPQQPEVVLPPHFGITPEALHAYVQVHGVSLSDIDLSVNPVCRTESAMSGAPRHEIRAFLDSFDVGAYVGRDQGVIGSPLEERDPMFWVAMEMAERQRAEAGGDGDADGVMAEFVREDVFGAEGEVSEERAELEWVLRSVGVGA